MDVLRLEGVVAALIALSTAAALIGRKVWAGARLAVDAADLIVGRGTDEHPGVDRRLGNVETGLAAVQHEVKRNGGGSLKDGVARLEDVVGVIAKAVQTLTVTASEAKERAAEAVDEAAKLSAALGRADALGREERRKQQESLDAVLSAFLDDRREQHQKTTAYVDALLELGIDLTPVARALEEDPWDGQDRRHRP